MRRSVLWVVPVLVLVVAGAAVAASLGATKRPTVKAAKTAGFGKLIVSSTGLTLYHYTDEKRGSIECTGGCAKLWPPLLVKAGQKPVAGPGLRAAWVGTIARPGGGRQVTYNGFALYRYSPDRKSGEVNGQGVDGEWYVVGSSGKLIRKAAGAQAAPPPPTETEPPPPTNPGGGYGYG
jgi:predicted lipoprotein with Yx(FWY)xxD motif